MGIWRTEKNLVQIRSAKPYRYLSGPDQNLYGICTNQKNIFFIRTDKIQTNICKASGPDKIQIFVCILSVRILEIFFRSVQILYRFQSGPDKNVHGLQCGLFGSEKIIWEGNCFIHFACIARGQNRFFYPGFSQSAPENPG